MLEPKPEPNSQHAEQSPLNQSPQESSAPELQDAELQAKYRQAFLEQLRRQACPGCGEGEIIM